MVEGPLKNGIEMAVTDLNGNICTKLPTFLYRKDKDITSKVMPCWTLVDDKLFAFGGSPQGGKTGEHYLSRQMSKVSFGKVPEQGIFSHTVKFAGQFGLEFDTGTSIMAKSSEVWSLVF